MSIIYGTLIVIDFVIAIIAWSYVKEKIGLLEKIGIFLYEKVYVIFSKRNLGREQKIREQYRAVYIGTDDKLQQKKEQAKIWGYIWLVVMCFSIVGMVLYITMPNSDLVDGNKLERPSLGMGETEYEITVSGVGDETQQVTITVGEQQPGEEQMNAVFASALEEVKQEVLGENVSLEEVRSDLNFFSITDKGIRLSWESGDETVLTSYGEVISEAIPQEGVVVSVTVYMTYATYEAWYSFYVRILPPIKDMSYYKNELTNMLQTSVEKHLQSEYAVLPTHLDQYQLSYQKKVDKSGLYVGGMGLVTVCLLIVLSEKQIETKYEKRKEQMMEDYSQIVSQLSILTTCGMNIRNAWTRVVKDYEKRKQNYKVPYQRYAYEEMKATNFELESGVPESKAYATFGRRCDVYHYTKLGNLLEQSVRQGVSGLEQALYKEATEALELKMHETKRRGEQVETKILIPMFIMLGIVMAVLMVPAFLSF